MTDLKAIALELAGHAQTGLTYASDAYDINRYTRLRELAAEMLATLGDADAADLKTVLDLAHDGYATPKVDVRGALFDAEDRVLLVREVSDDGWTLPGGWADVLDTPRLSVEREFAEEGGLDVRVSRLVGVWDGMVSNSHARHGPAMHIWKLFFLCDQVDSAAEPEAGRDGETSAVGFFDVDDLPVLSFRRTTTEQLRAVRDRHRDASVPPYVD